MAKLYINNTSFYECQKDDPMCISDIYRISNFGYPIDQSTNDILYTEIFEDPIENKNITENPITNLYVNGQPHLGEFRTEKQCLNWCAKNPNCKTMVRYLDREGNLQCRYYKYDINNNKIVTFDDNTSKIYSKNKYNYNPNLPKKILPKYKFPISSQNNLIDGCFPYGCCADGTKNATKTGSNCVPFTKNSRIVGDPYNLYQYSSLNGITKLGSIDKLSGNAYINY
jgi:hypothetical protein